MAYEKQTWDTTSYVNPTRMNHIEDGIANAMTSGNMSYLGAKNLNSTPYSSESRTSYGITWTVNADGTVTANGTATAQSTFVLHSRSNLTNALILPNGSYIISGCPSGGGSDKYYFSAGRTSGGAYSGFGNDYGNGRTITLNGDDYSDTEVRLHIALAIVNGQTVNNLVFKPMIRLAGDNDNTWTPYAMTNQELTKGVINLPTNLDKVEAGEWNCVRKPYANISETIGGIAWTVNEDDSITANGTASSSGNVSFYVKRYNVSDYHLPKGTYRLSGCPSGGQLSTYRLRVGVSADTSTSPSFPYSDDFGNGAVFTITDESVYVSVVAVVIAGVTVENLTFRPKIIPIKVPPCDQTTAGIYTLQCTVDANGFQTYSWV